MWKTQAGKSAHARIWLWGVHKTQMPKCSRKLSLLLSLIFLPTDPNSSYFLSGDCTVIPGFLFGFLSTHNTLQNQLPHYTLFPPSPFLQVRICRIADLGQSSEARFLSFSALLTLPFLRPTLCNSDDSAGTGPFGLSKCIWTQLSGVKPGPTNGRALKPKSAHIGVTS